MLLPYHSVNILHTRFDGFHRQELWYIQKFLIVIIFHYIFSCSLVWNYTGYPDTCLFFSLPFIVTVILFFFWSRTVRLQIMWKWCTGICWNILNSLSNECHSYMCNAAKSFRVACSLENFYFWLNLVIVASLIQTVIVETMLTENCKWSFRKRL